MSEQERFLSRVFTGACLVDVDLSRMTEWIDLVYISDLDAEYSTENAYWRLRFKDVTKFSYTLDVPDTVERTTTGFTIITSSHYRLIRSSNTSFEIMIQVRGIMGEGTFHIACRSMQTMPADHVAYMAIGKAWFERKTPHVLARFSADALTDLFRSTRPNTRE